MKDLVGRTLGQYRIEAILGFGGMGQVFRGKHVYLDRLVAVKVMHEHMASHSKFRARFLQEARATAALKDPHIVEIYEFGEQDGLLYLVMELLTGGTLTTFLLQGVGEQRQAPQLLVGLDLMRQAAEGLEAAHELGMIHRDIKPDNLLLTRVSGSAQEGGQYQLKISDFGLARLSESSGLTTGGPVGTPTYMSPEQCQNQVLDRRSDLYSLGVVLYEVVTGRLPFQINSFSEAVQKHVNAEPPPPREVRPDLPPIVEQIVLRCLAKRPEERYQTGKELAEALQEAINDAALETRAPLVAPVANPTPLQAPVYPPMQVQAAFITNRTTANQTQGTISKKRRWIPNWFFPRLTATNRTTEKQTLGTASTKRRRIPNWFFPGLVALLVVALVLAITIPRGGNPSSVGASFSPTPVVAPTTLPKGAGPLSSPTPVVTPTTPANPNLAQLYNTVTNRPTFYSSSALTQQDRANWDQNNQCHFQNDGYHVSASPGADSGVEVCFERSYNLPDFAFQVQMKINYGSPTTGGGGLIFRGTNSDNCYRWRVGPNGSYDVFHTPQSVSTGDTNIGSVLNQPILLTVIAQGNLIYLYVNNKFVTSVDGTLSNQGQVGFLAFAKDQSLDITFTGAKVWKL